MENYVSDNQRILQKTEFTIDRLCEKPGFFPRLDEVYATLKILSWIGMNMPTR
jgi:hypothetical protein